MRKVVRCFLQNDEWKYLLVKHKKSDNWTLPWGHIEENESIFEALHREIKEEFNLQIEILWKNHWFNSDNIIELNLPISIYNIIYKSNKHWIVEKQEYIFNAKITEWNIKIQKEEIDDYNFFTKQEILNLENTFNQIKVLIKTL